MVGVACEEWLSIKIPVYGVKVSSMVYEKLFHSPYQQETLFEEDKEAIKESLAPMSYSYACFCDKDANGCSLELYPRKNGEPYNILQSSPCMKLL